MGGGRKNEQIDCCCVVFYEIYATHYLLCLSPIYVYRRDQYFVALLSSNMHVQQSTAVHTSFHFIFRLILFFYRGYDFFIYFYIEYKKLFCTPCSAVQALPASLQVASCHQLSATAAVAAVCYSSSSCFVKNSRYLQRISYLVALKFRACVRAVCVCVFSPHLFRGNNNNNNSSLASARIWRRLDYLVGDTRRPSKCLVEPGGTFPSQGSCNGGKRGHDGLKAK